MRRTAVCAAMIASSIVAALAQTAARDQLARGQQLWDQRLK
jgi:hypothetical protein